MAKLANYSLTPRKEELREPRKIEVIEQFSLDEIYNHFDESMNSLKSQFEVAKSSLSSGNTEICKTIWRSQIVLSEGLLDFYIHEISKFCLFRMFTGEWKKSDKYYGMQIPMDKLEEAIYAKDSKTWFFEFLNEYFSRAVFLSKESMRSQLNMIGIGFNSVMHKAFSLKNEDLSSKFGCEVVESLFRRRNEIAHQNDRSHASAVQNDITEDYVLDYLNKIKLIVNAIHDLVVIKDRVAD